MVRSGSHAAAVLGLACVAACVSTGGLVGSDADGGADAQAPIDAAQPTADASDDGGAGATDADAGDAAPGDADAEASACPTGTTMSATRSPGTVQTLSILSSAGGGSTSNPNAVAWTTPNRAKASDDLYAESVLTSAAPNDVSQWLVLTNYGFTIPAGATIKGIRLDVERHAGAASTIKDLDVRILKGGDAILSVQKAKGDFFPTSDNVTSYGGPADLWTTTWTPAQIGELGFGVAFGAYYVKASGSDTASVDQAALVVFYECP